MNHRLAGKDPTMPLCRRREYQYIPRKFIRQHHSLTELVKRREHARAVIFMPAVSFRIVIHNMQIMSNAHQ